MRVLGNEVGIISRLVNKAVVLEGKINTDDFKENIEALSRILNIASKSNENGDIQEALFENDYEQQLYDKFIAVSGQSK